MAFRVARSLPPVVLLFVGAAVNAQCPDGSPPPCGRAITRVTPRAIDPNRLAVLPFRTSGADPTLAYLGTGLMDLLAAEFNGDIGPTAVDPGEALREWNRVGSSKEAPTQSAAVRVAQTLGAGRVAYGSIVGSPRHFTVTVSVLGVPTGSVLVPHIQVEGTADSLAAIVSTIATRLVGRTLGAVSSSDEAIREYNTGMAIYRTTGGAETVDAVEVAARPHFERAIELDSTFALPAFRLVLLRTLYGPSGPISPFAIRTAWNQRTRLSPEQRVLIEAMTDSTRMLYRMQMLPRMEHAIEAAPHSAEAWDILGDLYFHVGALIGRDNPIERAKQAFERAFELDSTAVVSSRGHLADIAFLEDDAKTFDRYATLKSTRAELANLVAWNRYRSALLHGDRKAIHAARIDVAGRYLLTRTIGPWFVGITLPAGELDSLIAQGQAMAVNDDQRGRLAHWTRRAATIQGRPTKALEASHIANDLDSIGLAFMPLESADENRAEVDQLSASVATLTEVDRGPCEVGLGRVRQGDTTGVSAILTKLPRWNAARSFAEIRPFPGEKIEERLTMVCREVLAAAASTYQLADKTALLRADSLMRFMPLNCCDWWNYDLALAFIRTGDLAAANRAVRRNWMMPAGASARVGARLRLEGKLAIANGDTASAVSAYREYLKWRDKPEAKFVLQRDSVIAELSAVEKVYRSRPRSK